MKLDNSSKFVKRAVSSTDIAPGFSGIGLSIASPEQIRSWSYGEIKRPETINYRTFKPESDGLFCASIFGPIKDYECLCGKYKRMKYKGVVCEKCKVEITTSRVRRDRMGHIELASPVAHIWFVKSLPSRIGLVLGITLKNIEKILCYEVSVVSDPGITSFEKFEIITDEQITEAENEFGLESFSVSTGADALKYMLESLDLQKESISLRAELAELPSDFRRKKIIKRLRLIESFYNSGTKPEWMILTVLPVIPPDLRPLVPLEGGRFATSDLNDLYRRIINRNNRLKRLIDLQAPDIIIRNEKRMLQESVDALFDNGKRGRAIVGMGKRPLKSLADMLRGKQGRFRQNLLGKRVDYSGRSVITVGPELKLHQCGIPKKMAIELFRPFIYAKLERYGLVNTLKTAKKMVEQESPEVWDILEDVIREHPVLLNRAPTLHRLGIQAFEPLLVEGNAIQLHPLVCTAYNADFDGDQMAVHVPLSLEAQLEARVLMMSTNHILSPSSGKSIIVPSKDIVLGIYYLSIMRTKTKGDGMRFCSQDEAEHALWNEIIELHSRIFVRVSQISDEGSEETILVETTAGRLKVFNLMPKKRGIKFDLVNKILTSTEIGQLTDTVHRYCGQKKAVIFVDRLMQIGFLYTTKSGISIGKDDLIVPEKKGLIVEETRKTVKEYEKQYMDGLITSEERYNKTVDAWVKCTDSVAKKMVDKISDIDIPYPNSVYMMMHSKTRGSVEQMKQLSGMRGLMSKPSGDIIETPIISNFKGGLNSLEYFISTHGTRKGLADMALKTANSGYLTRRLVDVAQDCMIKEVDCGTAKGIRVQSIIDGINTVVHFKDRIFGRVLQEDVLNESKECVIPKGTLIAENEVQTILDLGIDSLMVRSVLLCDSEYGVCAMCYGRDLARGEMIGVGEAVGVIAAQSIGEPGTQLTMRTFHIGGTAQKGAEQSFIDSPYAGKIFFENFKFAKNSSNQIIVLSRNSKLIIKDDHGRVRFEHKIPYGSRTLVQNEQNVGLGERLVDWDPYTDPVIAEYGGRISYVDLEDGKTLRNVIDKSTGIASRIVVESKASKARGKALKPYILIKDEKGKSSGEIEARYNLPFGAILNVNDKEEIKPGDIIARMPRETLKTRDITGGLPRVSELFEARNPKDPAIMSSIDGIVEFGKDYKTKTRVVVSPNNKNDEPMEYLVSKGRHVLVQDGDEVKKGDVIVSGSYVPQDILRILGVEALAMYLTAEVQKVYRLQGVVINDKHIEVITKQMLQKVEIVEAGDTEFLEGDLVDKVDIMKKNIKNVEEGLREAIYIPVLQGITKASLHTKSFISAASFQETTRVLTEAAISGKVDNLRGLKENVIVGRLIPAGTGATLRSFKKIVKKMKEESYKKREEDNLKAKKLQEDDLNAGKHEEDNLNAEKHEEDNLNADLNIEKHEEGDLNADLNGSSVDLDTDTQSNMLLEEIIEAEIEVSDADIETSDETNI